MYSRIVAEQEEDADRRDTLETIATSTAAVSPEAVAADPSNACLVVIYGADLGKRAPLGRTPIECGRAVQCDLALDDDAASRAHARFAWNGGSYVVTDLGSTNGTLVNDVTVDERTLTDGDQIKIGHTILKFICGGNIELSYHEEIYRLMTFDGLTEIHNKRSFEATLEREVSRGQRYQRPLSLLLFDIDHFKRINDHLGHLAGDAVLRQLAALVRANVRREDTLARVGGEEFALLVPEIEIDKALGIAEKLRALIERTPCQFEEHRIELTSSFGVAELALTTPMSPTELYGLADERLYRAKGAGRNRVM
jgi:diguanylate cyclase (GGDEF)-like protein